MNEKAKTLYNMKLGDFVSFNNNSGYTRVPGGWVYGDMQGCCFVPFDNEFNLIEEGVDVCQI